MEQYRVTGMSCAACSSRVEKAVSNVPGVTSCSVSLLTNSMGVEGTASASEIIVAVEASGYGASLKNAENGKSSFLEGVRERMSAAVSILRGKKSKVHPGAGRLKTYYCG